MILRKNLDGTNRFGMMMEQIVAFSKMIQLEVILDILLMITIFQQIKNIMMIV